MEPFSWEHPIGGGLDGGAGTGDLVNAQSREFVHSGKQAVRLMVWDNKDPKAMAWASVSQKIPCLRDSRVTARLWLYRSSSYFPVSETGTSFQIRFEFYSDDDGQQVITTHAPQGEPHVFTGHQPDEWKTYEFSCRVPPQAKIMRITFILMAMAPGAETQAVWLDDVHVEFQMPGCRIQTKEKNEDLRNHTPWWKRLL